MLEVTTQLAPVEPAPIHAVAGHPLVIGHRGSPRLHPENSFAGFQAAIDVGADGIELDVRLAADGVPVVCHDPDLWRTHQERVPLRSLPAHRLPVPTLETVLTGLSGLAPRAIVDIELKEPVAPATLQEVLDASGWRGRTVVTSFTTDLVRRHAAYGSWSTGLLVDNRHIKARDAIALVGHTGCDLLGVRNPVLLGSLLDALHQEGCALWVWTLNRRMQIQKAARLGADAIVTDLPGLALSVLRPDVRGPSPSA